MRMWLEPKLKGQAFIGDLSLLRVSSENNRVLGLQGWDERMILYMGVRTTDAIKVACRSLAPREDEASAILEFLGTLSRRGGFNHRMYDHSIIVYYDPPGISNRSRELLIPLSHEVGGVGTKVFPSVRVAFLVFKHTDTSLEEYYEHLRSYMEQSGLEAAGDIYSIEIMYIPEDLDMLDYTMEIMIPLAG